jgi:hypothetical protein
MKPDRYEQRKKRTNIIITIIVAFLMVASIFAFVITDLGQQGNELTYNKYTFQTVNNIYRTKINGNYMDFQYFPADLERINITQDIVNRLMNAKGMIIVFNPNESVDNLQYIDFARLDMSNQLSTPIGFAITKPSSLYSGLPVLGCQNSTTELPFIMINISSSSDFILDNAYPNCIIMNAELKDIVALKDRLVYRLLGVMQN